MASQQEETDELLGRVAERRCTLAMKALLDAAEIAGEVSAKEFPAQAPVELCALLEGVARKATDRIPKLSADSPQHAISQAELLALLAREIVEHVRYAERAVTLETPWSMVETIAESGRSLHGSGVSFIVRPKWSYNYSLVGEFVGYYLDKLQTLFPQSKPSDLLKRPVNQIYVISFPRLEKTNALLHACFAHELGHFISARWLASELPESGLLDKVKGRLVSYIKQDTQDPVAIASRLAGLQSEADFALKRGLDELLADVAAVMLFGPCVLFAMCQIATRSALAEAPSEGNEYYPPWGYRLHEVLRVAEKDVLSEAALILEDNGFDKAREHVDHFFREMAVFIGTKSDSFGLKTWPPAIRYAYEVIDAELSSLVRWVREALAEMKYEPDAKHLAHLCMDLDAGLPPLVMAGQEEIPTDFRDILNAGWLYLITRMKETTSSLGNEREEYRKQRRGVDLLVLKAIESSYLLQHHVPKDRNPKP